MNCHLIKNVISEEIVKSFFNSRDQLACSYKLITGGPQIQLICSKLVAYDLYAPAWGGVLMVFVKYKKFVQRF